MLNTSICTVYQKNNKQEMKLDSHAFTWKPPSKKYSRTPWVLWTMVEPFELKKRMGLIYAPIGDIIVELECLFGLTKSDGW